MTIPQFTVGQVLTAAELNAMVDEINIGSAVVQVKSTTKTDTFSMASTTFADITGLSVSITPTSASNKILIVATVAQGAEAVYTGNLRLMRDSTAIGVGATAGSRILSTSFNTTPQTHSMTSTSLNFLDSPATTSATTYKIQVAQVSGPGGTVYVNRSHTDTDNATYARNISTITVFEVTP